MAERKTMYDIPFLKSNILTRLLFRRLAVFSVSKLGFTLTFPSNVWRFRRVHKNVYWFINEKSNQALILNYYTDDSYTFEDVKSAFQGNFSETKIGEYNALMYCKRFIDDSISQYEWIIVDGGRKVIFSYSILDEKSDFEKDRDYEDANEILNTLKIK